MENPKQKTIDQYIEDKKIVDQDQKDKVLAAVTHLVYSRNQNVVKIEKATEDKKIDQYLRSVKEYDDIIEEKIGQILKGEEVETSYDF